VSDEIDPNWPPPQPKPAEDADPNWPSPTPKSAAIMVTCPNGHENPEGQHFCGECGAPIVGTVPAPQGPPVYPPPFQPRYASFNDDPRPSGRVDKWLERTPQDDSFQQSRGHAPQSQYPFRQYRQGLSRRAKIGLAVAAAFVAVVVTVILLLVVFNAPSQSYQFGYNEMGPAAMANVSLGPEPETLGAISARACNITIAHWQNTNATPSWWDFNDVLNGCVKYGTELRTR
jgi:hypothetical protein